MLEMVLLFGNKMKLLACKECNDLFELSMNEKKCHCGKSSGKYIDVLNVEVNGPCRILGIDSSAINEEGSVDFGIFTIDEKYCKTVKRKSNVVIV